MQVQDVSRPESWDRVKSKLIQELGEDVFQNWFGRAVVEDNNGGVVKLSVPTRFLKHWIQSNYQKSLESHWAAEDSGVKGVELTVRSVLRKRVAYSRPALTHKRIGANTSSPVSGETADAIRLAPKTLMAAPQRAGTTGTLSEALAGAPLNEKYTFDHFVMGEANRDAFDAAQRFSQIGGQHSSLFIHASVGLGKTHLLQAIAHAARRIGKRYCYMSAEHFMYQLVPALQSSSSSSLANELSRLDLLIIDDLQFLHGKQARAEFSKTLTSLIKPVRELVVAADRAPELMETLDAELKHQMRHGAVCSIGAPDFTLRRAILSKRAANAQSTLPSFEVPPEIIDYIASTVSSGGRDLEGAINRLVAHHQLTGQRISRFLVDKILSDLVRAGENRVVKIEDIQNVVCKHYNITRSDLLSACRARNLSQPRQIAMYLAKTMTPRSLPEIGKKFGGRDHTTVLHAVRKIEGLIAEDKALGKDISLLKRIALG